MPTLLSMIFVSHEVLFGFYSCALALTTNQDSEKKNPTWFRVYFRTSIWWYEFGVINKAPKHQQCMCKLIVQSKVFHQTPLCKHWHPQVNHRVIKESEVFREKLLTSARSFTMIMRDVLFFFSILIDIHHGLKLANNPRWSTFDLLFVVPLLLKKFMEVYWDAFGFIYQFSFYVR